MQFIEGFLSSAEAAQWLDQLELADWIAWKRESFRIYGREVDAPRTLSWFGDAGLNYRYTSVDHRASGWPAPIKELKDAIEQAAQQPFNFLLLNRYANGSEHMGWHRDDERGCSGNIASLSLGAMRRFSIDLQNDRQEISRQTLELGEGSLLVFDGRQRHCLRPTKKPCGTRINLTFRQIAL